MQYRLSNKIDNTNDCGDVQLDMDVQTDSLIFECLKDTGVVYAGISEERPQMVYLCPDGEYIVTFDPLDGSSIIDCNLAVGSIFAIWKRIPGKEDMNGRTGREIIGAALSCYGSRTSCLVYNCLENRVDELSL
jgi:sedoheptulose-bisphosphatase